MKRELAKAEDKQKAVQIQKLFELDIAHNEKKLKKILAIPEVKALVSILLEKWPKEELTDCKEKTVEQLSHIQKIMSMT
eukprot:CAMPEP_0168333516 /NCGR_PEP_ID=MMETSP0213-20121227/9654_1 /TAXON_ID=151035 /ORGANISM="Euplotes harpa, Strain FSP1.4" /LENGTH=78 /DNA_ID=CAMNT_0008337855 /DNA_START=719 /DNA_END=952 /DNA_ORIENTATION=-